MPADSRTQRRSMGIAVVDKKESLRWASRHIYICDTDRGSKSKRKLDWECL